MSRKTQRGFSLIETLVSLGLVGVMLGQAAPSLSGMVQRQRLQGEAEAFRSDFQRARMLALGSGRTVRIAFGDDSAGSCYVVYQGERDACSCSTSGEAVCREGAEISSQRRLARVDGPRLESNSELISIDASLGTVTPAATVRFIGTRGDELAHVVSVTGRLRSCGSAEHAKLPCA